MCVDIAPSHDFVYRAIFQESLPYELKGQGRFALINHSQSAVHIYIYMGRLCSNTYHGFY